MSEVTEVVDVSTGEVLWSAPWREANFLEYVPMRYLNMHSTKKAIIRVVEEKNS